MTYNVYNVCLQILYKVETHILSNFVEISPFVLFPQMCINIEDTYREADSSFRKNHILGSCVLAQLV